MRALFAGEIDFMFSQKYGIKFTGNFSDDGWGNYKHLMAVVEGVQAVGRKLSQVLNDGSSSAKAFRAIYGTNDKNLMEFQWGNCPDCNGSGAYTNSSHEIQFESISDDPLRARNNIVHELGHAFNARLKLAPAIALGYTQSFPGKTDYYIPNFPNRPDFPVPLPQNWVGDYFGFASRQNELSWQVSVAQAGALSEEFADQFLGWTFNKWRNNDAGFFRSAWMNGYMPGWISSAAGY